MGKVLVIGGSGFLGAYICQNLLDSGHRPISVDVSELDQELAFVLERRRSDVIFESGSALNRRQLEALCAKHEPSAIVYAAGSVDVETGSLNPEGMYAINTFGVLHALDAARISGVGRVILISSNAVYSSGTEHPTEDSPIFSARSGHETGHYGASKSCAEVIGMAYYGANCLDVRILRMASIYGFGMRRGLSLKPFINAALDGTSLNIRADSDPIRNYTHVKDAAASVTAALLAEINPGEERIFNISGDVAYAASDVVKLVKELFPKADLSYSVCSSGKPVINAGTARIDCNYAKQKLGFRNTISLRDGVVQYYETLKAYRDDENRNM